MTRKAVFAAEQLIKLLSRHNVPAPAGIDPDQFTTGLSPASRPAELRRLVLEGQAHPNSSPALIAEAEAVAEAAGPAVTRNVLFSAAHKTTFKTFGNTGAHLVSAGLAGSWSELLAELDESTPNSLAENLCDLAVGHAAPATILEAAFQVADPASLLLHVLHRHIVSSSLFDGRSDLLDRVIAELHSSSIPCHKLTGNASAWMPADVARELVANGDARMVAIAFAGAKYDVLSDPKVFERIREHDVAAWLMPRLSSECEVWSPFLADLREFALTVAADGDVKLIAMFPGRLAKLVLWSDVKLAPQVHAQLLVAAHEVASYCDAVRPTDRPYAFEPSFDNWQFDPAVFAELVAAGAVPAHSSLGAVRRHESDLGPIVAQIAGIAVQYMSAVVDGGDTARVAWLTGVFDATFDDLVDGDADMKAKLWARLVTSVDDDRSPFANDKLSLSQAATLYLNRWREADRRKAK